MSSVAMRHDVGDPSSTALDPTIPADFVALLALIAATPDDGRRADALARLAEHRPDSAWLEEYLDAIAPSEIPTHGAALDGWLLGVEALALAASAYREHIAKPYAAVLEVLDRAEVRLTLVADQDRTWDCPLVATVSRGEMPATMPWRCIRSRTARGQMTPGNVDPTAIAAWIRNTLHAEDVASLKSLLRDTGAWRDAYVRTLAIAERTIHPPRVDPEQSISAAASPDELDAALVLLSIPVPHLGDTARLEARLGVDAVVWWWRGTDRPLESTPLDAAAHTLHDDVLGTHRIAIARASDSELDVAADVRASTERLGRGLVHPRAETIALHVADDFAGGRFRRVLERAAIVFTTGIDGAQDDERWVETAFTTRIALSELAARLCLDAVDIAIDQADARISHCGDALMLLDDDVYDRAKDDAFLDPDRWWGARERLADAPTDAELEDSLASFREPGAGHEPAYDNLVVVPFGVSRARDVDVDPPRWLAAADSSGPHGALDALAAADPGDDTTFELAFREACARLWALPCPSLDRSLSESIGRMAQQHPTRTAELAILHRAVSPQVGCVPVVLVDTRDERGLLVRLRVSVGARRRDPHIGPLAWEAMERAFVAVTRLTPSSLPRDSQEDLVLEIDGLPADARVDGGSLALPAAIAIASLWLGRPPPPDLVATGDIRANGEIGLVDRVRVKAAAIAHAANGTSIRLLVPTASAMSTDVPGVTMHGVDALEDALRLATLSLHDAAFTPRWPDLASLRQQMDADIARVQQQSLGGLGDVGDPWRLLGLRLRQAIDVLAREGDDEALLGRARAHCSLAYQHAGLVHEAIAVLGDSTADHDDPGTQLLRGVIAIGNAIDTRDWPECARLSTQLDEGVTKSPARVLDRLLGIVLGAQARALLHAGHAHEALDRARGAVTWHATHVPHEAARSRILLAGALRTVGAPEAALEQLSAAALDLAAANRFSRPYGESTRVFLEYERARVFVALHRDVEARESATNALAHALGRGFWPQLGILRVLAWAEKRLGNPAAHADVIARMRGLDVTDAHVGLRDRLVAVATAGPEGDDEVY